MSWITQIWLASTSGEGRRRTKAILEPSGEKTQASGRGAVFSGDLGVRRVVMREARSVTHTLLSRVCVIDFPSGLQSNAEEMGKGL